MLVSFVLPHNTHLTEVMMVVNYLTFHADSDMESPHNSLLTLAWSPDCILSSKQPPGHDVYAASSDAELDSHDSEIGPTEQQTSQGTCLFPMSIFSDYTCCKSRHKISEVQFLLSYERPLQMLICSLT